METANDPQLRKLLREWQVEDAPASLDWRISGIPGRSRSQKALRGTVLVIAATFLLVVSQAIPQTLKLLSAAPPPPYTVESEYLGYPDGASPRVEMYSTSYLDPNGNEVILQRTLPHHFFGTAFGRTLDALLTGPRTTRTPQRNLPRVAPAGLGVVTGCSPWTCLTVEHWYFRKTHKGAAAPCADGMVVGNEDILGYATTAVQRPLPNSRATASNPAPARITMWMAPALGCFALRVTVDELAAGGAFRHVSRKQALKVAVSSPRAPAK